MKAGSGDKKLRGLLCEPRAEAPEPSSRIPLPSLPGAETCSPSPGVPMYMPATAEPPAPELVLGLGLRVPRMGDGAVYTVIWRDGHRLLPLGRTEEPAQGHGERGSPCLLIGENIVILAGTVPSPPPQPHWEPRARAGRALPSSPPREAAFLGDKKFCTGTSVAAMSLAIAYVAAKPSQERVRKQSLSLSLSFF